MGHAHDESHDAPHDDGPAVIPPEPVERSITPAPEDFATPAPTALYIWPVVWVAVIALLGWGMFAYARGTGFAMVNQEDHDTSHGSAEDPAAETGEGGASEGHAHD